VGAYRREFGTRVFSSKLRKLLAPVAHWFAFSGIRTLRSALDAGIIPIVSLTTNTADTHLVVLTGYEKGSKSGFYYNDPAASEERDGAHLFMDMNTFSRRWRQMALFVG
jgi:hypothetical protein